MEEEEILSTDKKHKKDKDNKEKPKFVVRTLADLQRLKLEKLMKNKDKPVIIPELTGEKDFKDAIPSFVRNVMGSSAGAGSGEFHVYRHLRRKEYARQKHIQQKSLTEKLDQEYRDRIESNQKVADEKTAKKRAKRLKKKKNRQKKPKLSATSDNGSDSDSIDEEAEEKSESNADEDEKKSDNELEPFKEVQDEQLEKTNKESEPEENLKDCSDDELKSPENKTQELDSADAPNTNTIE